MKLYGGYIKALLFLIIFILFNTSGGSGESTLSKILKKRDVQRRPAGELVIPQVKAKEFLSAIRRPRRNLWDRSRPDVQQWIQQFMHMGYDEARLETDLAYWMDHAKANDQGRQHHYDENAAMAGQDASAIRHGANVNYDYY
ncbi:augurin-B [Clarias gariepinus]|uniref:augurin-B n=1 Tax=Clarias gariepinus TaxID=13013 RepID=UPI00234CCD92|nr:augurin-B [Clarias gariepinus]